MADAFMMGSIMVGVLNVVLTSLLLAVYGGVYGKTKAPFTRGLLLFAAAFLSHNVLVVYAYLTMMPLVPEALNPFLLGIGAFEAAGLGSILWTATR